MRNAVGWVAGLFFLLQAVPAIHAQQTVSVVSAPALADDDNNIAPQGLRAGRSGFRSPRSGYTGGNRTRNPGVNNPARRTPAAPATRTGGFFGGMFGGLLAGTLLGSLLNPFGFGGAPGGFSLLGLIFWAVILYFAYRLIRRAMNRGR